MMNHLKEYLPTLYIGHPEEIMTIESFSFFDLTQLISIKIRENMILFVNYLFHKCTSLTIIEEYLFQNYVNL